MLEINNSKLLADIIMAGLITVVLISVLKSRQPNRSTPLLFTLLAVILLVIQITVDIALASGAITGNEQNLITVMFRWRSVLIALIAGLLVGAVLLLLLREKVISAPLTTQPIQPDAASDTDLQQLNSVRTSQRQRALGSLMGHVSHQLQNQFAIMLSHVELSQRILQDDSPLQEKLIGVHQSLLFSSQFLRSVSAFKTSHHRDVAPVDMVRTLKQLTPLLTEIMPATIALDVNLPEQSLMINGDDTDLQLVVVCLVSDALEILGNDRGEIKISVYEKSSQTAVIKVHSSGFLATADTVSNSLLPFASNTEEPSSPTGAGFSTIEQVVARHGGDIDVTSSQHSGTTVALYFPRIISPEKTSSAQAAS